MGTIPTSQFSTGELLVTFGVSASTESKKCGIDNVGVIGVCQSAARALGTGDKQEAAVPSGEPGWDADDGSYYCSAADFPCEGDKDKVYICHYSSKGGYHTFCIPEADSEVLRFYS